MLVTKTNPVGIDENIDMLQRKLYTKLGWPDHVSYNRVYVNETENGLMPEHFQQGKDYKEVMFNDKNSATSYFVVGPNVQINEKATYNVSIYFQVILDQIYPSINHRADEEAHQDVLRVLSRSLRRNEIGSLITGVRSVYSGWNTDAIQYVDLQPFHVFRIDLEITIELPCK